MALGNFPYIPDGIGDKIFSLSDLYKSGRIPGEEIWKKLISTAGRTRVDSKGIAISGNYGRIEFDRDDFKALTESALNLADIAFLFNGKEMLVKCGDKIEKLTFGVVVKREDANVSSAKDQTLPMVEFDPDENGKYPEELTDMLERALFSVWEGVIDYTKSRKYSRIKIHRMEEVAGWFENWEEFAQAMEILTPLLELTVIKKIKKNGDPIIRLGENFLNLCGV